MSRTRRVRNLTLSRRATLRGLFGISIGLPFLDAMGRARSVSAQGAPGITKDGFPKRAVFMFSPNGTIPDNWIPTGTENQFELSRILAPLAPHQDKIVVLQGIDQVAIGGDGHQNGMAGLLTANELNPGPFQGGNANTPPAGWVNGISVDQHIANGVGNLTKFKSLEFGVQVGQADNWGRMSYAGPDQPVPPEESPYVAFNRVFGDFAAPNNISQQILIERERRVLDYVLDDYRSLIPRVGADDARRLDRHLTAVSEIENRLGLQARAATEACALPVLQGPDDVQSNENFPVVGRLFMDLLVMSLACDLTHVASLMWNRAVGGARFSWIGIERGHHEMSHDGDDIAESVESLTKINVWYAEQYAYLIQKMKEIPEGEKTMLDNTVMLWGNELGKGNSHTRNSAPYVLAGSAGGEFRTGRFLRFVDTKHSTLLLSLINVMGLPDTEFGHPDWHLGPLTELTS